MKVSHPDPQLHKLLAQALASCYPKELIVFSELSLHFARFVFLFCV